MLPLIATGLRRRPGCRCDPWFVETGNGTMVNSNYTGAS